MTPINLVKPTMLNELGAGDFFLRPGIAAPILLGKINETPACVDLSDFSAEGIKGPRGNWRGYTLPARIMVDHASGENKSAEIDNGVPLGSVMIHSAGWAIRAKAGDGEYWIQIGGEPVSGERGLMVQRWIIQQPAGQFEGETIFEHMPASQSTEYLGHE